MEEVREFLGSFWKERLADLKLAAEAEERRNGDAGRS